MFWASRRRPPPADRVSLVDHQGLVGELAMLRRLVTQQHDVVRSLSRQVVDLRGQLATARKVGVWEIRGHGDQPAVGPLPAPEGALAEQVAVLRATFDELNEAADSLWFETQWLRAQLAVATGEFAPYDRSAD